MRITDLMSEQAIMLGAAPDSKNQAIDIMVGLHEAAGNIADARVYKEGILKRESEGSTAIGEGIAIPHAKNRAVKRPAVAAMTVPQGVDYEALDEMPSNLFFMIAAPEDGGDVHLEVLSRLSMLLMDEDFRKSLLAAKDKKEFLKVIDEKEIEKFPQEVSNNSQEHDVAGEKENQNNGYRILAVTACPTGIAHTYMAAEALEKAGQKLGYPLKAETNGSGGVKNRLTKLEIEQCDGIIVAADKNVEMARFDGKPVIITKVADGIHKPEELINKIVNKEAPIYHSSEGVNKEQPQENESVGRRIYKHLMNGVSHMLPFVIGGGILIAIAFLLDDYSINPAKFGTNTPVAAWFKSLGDTAFGFMLPILAGFIAMSIADRPGLMVGFVGGAIASSGMTFANPEGNISAGFLGALLAGFVSGYIIIGLKKLCSYLPDILEGIKPVLIYPVAGLLAIGCVMCIINPVMGMINSGLGNGLTYIETTWGGIVVGCIVAGMMAVDMGGPFNKAAYLFGTGLLAGGASSKVMAAVMIGGMVPPIAIALATTFFKKKFTADERKSGFVNYIMGLCFITEGAIPFAASDPLRVIPACVVGSAVAGGISEAIGCSIRAPHGGVFVFALVEHPFGYIAALVVGSLVGMLLLRLLKKNVNKETA